MQIFTKKRGSSGFTKVNLRLYNTFLRASKKVYEINWMEHNLSMSFLNVNQKGTSIVERFLHRYLITSHLLKKQNESLVLWETDPK